MKKYYLRGKVIKGEEWGKMIGFPTANLSHEYFRDHPVPSGVYAGWTWLDGRPYKSSNIIGIKHLAAPKQKKIETHLIGIQKSLYGKQLTVELVKKIRPIKPFRGMPSLVQQIRRDNINAMAILRKDERERKARSKQLVSAINKGTPVLRQGFNRIKKDLKPGVTERQIARKMLRWFNAKGFKPSFPPPKIIVAFNGAASEPHHQYTNRRLKKGDLIKLDFGINVNGWCTDLTRTLFLGRPTPKQRKIYQIVLRAQRAAIAGARIGETGADVDTRARAIIQRAGYGPRFIHGTGHGLGTRVHEPPVLRPSADLEHLRDGDVVTIEPGVYIKGWGGIRIEDMVLVRNGKPRVLSAAIPKDLSSMILNA